MFHTDVTVAMRDVMCRYKNEREREKGREGRTTTVIYKKEGKKEEG